jgi:predicted Zn-dependent peptidase
MALDALYGLGVDESLQYPEKIRAIDPVELQRVATRILRLDAAIIATIRP